MGNHSSTGNISGSGNITIGKSSRVLRSNTAEAVLAPLKNGFQSLNEVYQALIKADVDPVTGQCSNYQYIRQQIVQAHEHLQQSEQAVSSGLESLDRNLETLIQDEGKLEREVNNTKQTLDNSQKDDQLRQTREQIQKVKEMLEAVAEFQKKLRSAVHLLGVLSGKTSVVEHQTRKFIIQEPIINVMEDVLNAMKKVTGIELLYDKEMSTLIEQMKENNQRLTTICAS